MSDTGSGGEPTPGDTMRDYTAILENQMGEGIRTIERPSTGQFVSALSCGFDLGLGPLFLIAMATVAGTALDPPLLKFPMSLMYTFGFVYVVLGHSELFTEHTTLAVLPVLAGDKSVRELGRLWGLVWSGNIVGGVFMAVLIARYGPTTGVITRETVVGVATPFVELSPVGVFVGALLAGWLMGLLSWLLTSAGDSITRLTIVVLTTFVIGFFHLPHCVAGNIEVLAGIFAGAPISYGEWAQFLAITTVGNAVGGVVFVSIIKYAHVRRGRPEPEGVAVEQQEGVGIDARRD
ncbi:formate/nitrite transporter family protein [Haloarcula litorea]|uniref:formate/nitrite transporter family protein n=1 Tax=Haloarcula litorea TaxID=3032579 RepID=UPI0023E8FA3A|nr:formate/nitrite transporter family protein [Halomicroarcula sp. GDY20]